MHVTISGSYRAVPVLPAPFRGRLSQANKAAILAAFGNAEEVLAAAGMQQLRGDICAHERIGNAIISTDNSRTMVSRVVDETVMATHEVATLQEAAALVKAAYGCDVSTNLAGPRSRLSAGGRIISCGKREPFNAEQIASSVPMVATLVNNRGAILATVI